MKTLHGLSLSSYRGIGRKQQIGPFGRCNFFIGANNAGKSAVLNFLSTHGSSLNRLGVSQESPVDLAFAPLEVHLGKTIHDVEIGIALPPEQLAQRLSKYIHPDCKFGNDQTRLVIGEFMEALAQDGFIWLSGKADKLYTAHLDQRQLGRAFGQMSPFGDRRILESAIGGAAALPQEWVPIVQQWIVQGFFDLVGEPALIPAIRQIGSKGADFSDFSGKGLIDELAALQNPGAMERSRRERFDRINSLLQAVTGVPTAQIEIPHDRHEILVHAEQRVLPLSFLGTGIHEMVMIASFCTIMEDSIVCIEEPEIHLHPLLQRKLIDYLITKTTNQYFIATHSASMIDYPDAAIFHVTQQDGETIISAAITAIDRVGICRDLGYKASDLLQTNFIIWVEGPSDRIYLLHWLSAKAPDLVEGIHFSIMFYGGRLLSHLSGDDEIVEDFINLRRLNQQMAIVIDSDLREAGRKLNATKCRIIQEFEKHDNVAWVTAGREIESYFSTENISDALKSKYEDFGGLVSPGQYGDPLAFRRTSKPDEIAQPDKVYVARYLCKEAPDFDVLDLGPRVEALIKAIRDGN